jgi:hypothetical protein
MAVVANRTNNTWLNGDGLFVALGPAEGTATNSGEYRHVGGRHIAEFIISLPSLPTVSSGDEQILSDSVTIPNGAFIEEVRVTVLKETTGTNANLDMGLVDQDRSTEIDFNGFLAAADAFNAGTDLGTVTTFNVGTTEAGALIGTKITNTGLVTASAETADWTAGVIKVEIFYSLPLSTDL